MLSDCTLTAEEVKNIQRLNPCSNGICSLTMTAEDGSISPADGLNPCSNGICSLTIMKVQFFKDKIVLILVLMEYAL